MTDLTTRRVAPFGHLGLNACVPLPRAFRSLPRPSSPPCAQASFTCLRPLDYKFVASRARAISTSDNFAKVSQFDSLSHDLPLTSVVKQRVVPQRGGSENAEAIEFGNGCSRRATYGCGFRRPVRLRRADRAYSPDPLRR